MQRKIEDRDAPYDDPPYSEDGEPPFLAEWSRADVAIDVLGRSCLSMLSASLHLHFSTWESELGISWSKGEKAKVWRNGFGAGYLPELLGALGLSMEGCPAELAVIEQVFLGRNRDQHPGHMHTMRVTHSKNDLAKYPSPFFVKDQERALLLDPDLAGIDWLSLSVHVGAETLHRAIDEAGKLVGWLEPQFVRKKCPPG